jgi:hypothetical protein
MITPLIEIPSIPWDYINDQPAKSINDHLRPIPGQLERFWGDQDRLFLDLLLIPPNESMADGRRPLAYIFDEARVRSLKLIPVTGLTRENEYQDVVRDVILRDNRGVCLRIEGDDIEDPDFNDSIDSFLSIISLQPPAVDIIIDFKDIPTQPHLISRLATIIRGEINSLPHLREWRTITFAATGFPQDLSGVAGQTISMVSRSEWIIWNSTTSGRIGRKPSFGDYGISHPEPVEIDPRIMTRSASIRYTTEDNWLIVKGRSVKYFGSGQYYSLCQTLIHRQEYSGQSFSWGDEYINSCAAGQTGPGSAMTWRKVGNSHHLAFVVDQISNLP